jgi:hypothetical protein
VRLAGLYGVKRTLDLPHAEPLPVYANCPLAATCRPDKRNRYPAIIYDLYL